MAKIAGVSVSTASLALNDKKGVNASTRLRVKAVAEKLNYVPNTLAQGLVTKRTNTVGVIVSDLGNPFFIKVLKGIEKVLYTHGLNILLCDSDENEAKEVENIEILMSRQVEGLIISPCSDRLSLWDSSLLRESFPAVLLDREIKESEYDAVVLDNEGGSFKALEYLIELGHRRIGIIAGPQDTSTGRARLNGYRRALSEHGIAVDEGLIRIGDFQEQSGKAMMSDMLRSPNPPSAVLVCNNWMTIGALKCLQQENLRIPEDVSIIGFDDMIWLTLNSPPLTAVAQPIDAIGESLAELLMQKIKAKDARRKRRIVLAPELIIRESCRSVHKQ